ncbi:hypothetical protein P8605_38055, partial [Streptomyces sp. T-3]|nr:hypothetical protein [Streptomyces sp. T-3]
SPGPGVSEPGVAGENSESPDGGTSSQAPGGPATPGGGPTSEAGRQPTDDGKYQGDTGKWAERVVGACRAYRNGTLDPESRERLESAAKGAERVRRFCDQIIEASDGKPDKGKGDHRDDTDPQFGEGDGHGDGSAENEGGGNHHESDGSAGAPVAPEPTYSAPVETPAATPTATPTASASQGV